MAESTEVIHDQLEQTRSSLADKLAQLGDKIGGTVEAVEETVETVTETTENAVEGVKQAVETVTETAEEAVEGVKYAFDIPQQVRDHPWLVVGGAVLLGYIGGRLLTGGSREAQQPASQYSSPPAGPAPQHHSSYEGLSSFPQESPPAPSQEDNQSWTEWFSGMTENFGPEINTLKGLALGAVFGVVRDMVTSNLPESLKPQLSHVIDDMTNKFGGQPIRGQVMDDEAEEPTENSTEPSSQEEEDSAQEDSSNKGKKARKKSKSA